MRDRGGVRTFRHINMVRKIVCTIEFNALAHFGSIAARKHFCTEKQVCS